MHAKKTKAKTKCVMFCLIFQTMCTVGYRPLEQFWACQSGYLTSSQSTETASGIWCLLSQSC